MAVVSSTYIKYGELIYHKKYNVRNDPGFKNSTMLWAMTDDHIVIRFRTDSSHSMVVVSSLEYTKGPNNPKEYNFKHGSKSFVTGFRWFRKKTSQGYAMGLIESHSLTGVGDLDRRIKTFIEIFNPFEYKLLLHARERILKARMIGSARE